MAYEVAQSVRSGRSLRPGFYDDKPLGLLFIIFGLFAIAMGVVNKIFCRNWYEDYYVAIIGGVVLIIFGIVGIIHKGHYTRTHILQNATYIFLGFVSTIVAFAAIALVMQNLLPVIREVAPIVDMTSYYQLVNSNKTFVPVVETDASIRIWLCMACDVTALIVFMASLLALTAAMLVLDEYWNQNYHVTGTVMPYCVPVLFNSYGQLSLAEAMIFMGIFNRFACECENLTSDCGDAIAWYLYMTPSLAGLLALIAGFAACLGSKWPDRVLYNFITIILELLSIVGSGVAGVICVLGGIDNINTLNSVPRLYSEGSTQWARICASAGFYFVSVSILAINFLYSIVLIYYTIMFIANRNKDEKDRKKDEWRKRHFGGRKDNYQGYDNKGGYSEGYTDSRYNRDGYRDPRYASDGYRPEDVGYPTAERYY